MTLRGRASATRPPLSVIERHAALLRSDPLYLDRCQVDTPADIVSLVLEEVAKRRSEPAARAQRTRSPRYLSLRSHTKARQLVPPPRKLACPPRTTSGNRSRRRESRPAPSEAA